MDADRRMYVHRESKLFAKGAQLRDAGLRAVSKAEVAAFMNATHLQYADKYVAHKICRGHAGQCFIKGQHEDGIDAGFSQQAEALRKKCEQLRRFLGIQELRRMGVEGDGDGAHTARLGFGCDLSQYFLVNDTPTAEVSTLAHHGAVLI